jgi:hypothetical protein
LAEKVEKKTLFSFHLFPSIFIYALLAVSLHEEPKNTFKYFLKPDLKISKNLKKGTLLFSFLRHPLNSAYLLSVFFGLRTALGVRSLERRAVYYILRSGRCPVPRSYDRSSACHYHRHRRAAPHRPTGFGFPDFLHSALYIRQTADGRFVSHHQRPAREWMSFGCSTCGQIAKHTITNIRGKWRHRVDTVALQVRGFNCCTSPSLEHQ